MHKPEDASKIATVIALIFEGIGMFTMLAFAAGINIVGGLDVSLFMEEGMTQSQAELVVSLLDILGVVFFVLGGFLLIIFMVNLVLFTKLLTGRFDQDQASKTYLYQIIWGALNLLFNQVSGVAYLISGIKGRSTKLNQQTKQRQDREQA